MEETHVCQQATHIGSLQAKVEYQDATMKYLLQRLDESVKMMAQHIKDGEWYREKILDHDIKMKLLTWIFSGVNLLILGILLRLLFK